jgi:hypothetical protein
MAPQAGSLRPYTARVMTNSPFLHASAAATSNYDCPSLVPDRFGSVSSPTLGRSAMPPEFQSTSTPTWAVTRLEPAPAASASEAEKP